MHTFFDYLQGILGLALAWKIISVIGGQQEKLNKMSYYDSRNPRTWHFLEK